MTDYDQEERYLRETLAMLKESYDKAAKPYIDRLVLIHHRRTPEPLFVTVEQVRLMGFEIPTIITKEADDEQRSSP